MSPAEVLFRLRRSANIRVERYQLPNLIAPSADFTSIGHSDNIPPLLDPKPYLDKADRLMSGKIDVFELTDFEFGTDPDWNADPLTGKRAPLEFGKTLNYRDEKIVGSVKHVWEPARHRHLACLAQAWKLTGNDSYLHFLVRQVMSWITQCPFGFGIHWCSSLECAIRLLNWAQAWRIVGGTHCWQRAGIDKKTLARWLESIYQHMYFIDGYYSRFSSANNHLIGEAAGVYVASMTWPVWEKSDRWAQRARSILLEQTRAQVHGDGVSKEQSTGYQQFVLDFLLAAGIESLDSDDMFPADYWDTIRRMLNYVAAIMDRNGNVPAFGDFDDGFVFDLAGESDVSNFCSQLATGAALFHSDEFRCRSDEPDSKTKWLLSGRLTGTPLASRPTAALPKKAFNHGGYFILDSDVGCDNEIQLVFDAGPLGLSPLCAHGHADALSFTLSVRGEPILVDPGTYTYAATSRWRDYFRGTAAHNTVRVDECDQSIIGGNFIWLSTARTQLDLFEALEYSCTVQASHDGYMRLSDPVRHVRRVCLDKRARAIRIEDRLLCRSSHFVEILFHCAPSSVASRDDATIVVANKSCKIAINPDARLQSSIHVADSARPLGWVSRAFGIKDAAPTIRCAGTIHGDTTFETVMHVS